MWEDTTIVAESHFLPMRVAIIVESTYNIPRLYLRIWTSLSLTDSHMTLIVWDAYTRIMDPRILSRWPTVKV